MCGIAGILADSASRIVSLDDLRRMVAVLRHRGPDGYGLYRDDRVGLAHARLSIIDLAGGAQPIHNEDKTVWITFNGEIFNYVELRADLEACGHRFYTQSDTEVIVHAFEEYGEDAWGKFNGQFAFGLWDARARRLWLVRDRVGILPLYYARISGLTLFASEAKAIFASGHLSPAIDGAALGQVFTCWSVAAPDTIFAAVRSVVPGGAVCFDEHGRETQSRYWQADFEEDPRLARLSAEDAADVLGERLTRAVKLRLRADVPVGAYLSGGLDSSVIGRLIHRDESSPLQTFAVRFEDPVFDETVQQRRMAGLLGTQHHEILCGPGSICDVLPELVWHSETPLLRTAPAPLFLLSGLVRGNGMKVVLTGEGADELIAGYDIFKEDKIRRFWSRQPESVARPAMLARLYSDVGQGQQQTQMWQQFFGRGLADVDHPFYSHRVRWENTGWTLRFLAPSVRERLDRASLEGSLCALLPTGWQEWRPLARAQLVEMVTFLSSYLLSSQGDRVAMAHGVEVRYPFLDPEVIDFCCRLPAALKLLGLRDKRVLRVLASRFLPEDIWQRPKKPYRAPMTTVLFSPREPDYVGDLLSRPALARWGWIDCDAADRLVQKARRNNGVMGGEREEMAIVGLLTLQLLGHWYLDRFAGRVAEALSRLESCRPDVLEDRSRA